MMIYIKISQVKTHWSYPEKIGDFGHWSNTNSKIEVKFCFSENMLWQIKRNNKLLTSLLLKKFRKKFIE